MPAPDPLQPIPFDVEVRDIILRQGVKECCADCLAAVLSDGEMKSTLAVNDDEAGEVPTRVGEMLVREYARTFQRYSASAATAWLHVFASFCGCIAPHWNDKRATAVSEKGLLKMIAGVRKHHPDLVLASGLGGLLDKIEAVGGFLDTLWAHGELEMAKVLDVRLVIDQVNRKEWNQGDFQEPQCLDPWFELFEWQVLPRLFPVFARQPDAVVGPLAFGIDRALWRWEMSLAYQDVHDDPELEYWRYRSVLPTALASALTPYLAEMLTRVEKAPENEDLVQMCWRYARLIHSRNPEILAQAQQEMLMKAAIAALGRLRVLAREAHTPEATARFQGKTDFYNDALKFVGIYGSVWNSLKPLILALRAMSAPTVGPDLRYSFGDDLPAPPQPWFWIADWAASVLHTYAGKEQEDDAKLEELRGEMAEFCLARLKTGEKEIERSATWRYAYVRAARELRINPRGRGHHVLNWSRKSDPEKSVRDAAEEAYTELRHDVDLPEKRSPRRAVLAALWWLRRAHFIELRGEAALDVRGALRTRNREGRNTQESEERMSEP